MATGKSGNIPITTSNPYISGKLYYSESYNTASNTSDVTLTLKLRRTNSYTGNTTPAEKSPFTLWAKGQNHKTTISGYGVTIPPGGTEVQICSHTFTNLPHNSDGSLSIKIGVEGTLTKCGDAGNIKVSLQESNITLTKIARISTLAVTATSFTLGTPSTLAITRESSSYTDTVTYTCGSQKNITIKSKTTDTSFSFTPPASLASQNTTGTNVSITYTITTYSGDTAIGSKTVTKTYAIPSSIVPTISSFSLTEAVAGIAAQFQAYVNGKSKITWNVVANGVDGSEIKSYSVSIAGQTGTEATGTTDFISIVGLQQTATVTVTDSRGRTATATATFDVYDYTAPVFREFSAYRTSNGTHVTDDGEILRLWLNFDVSSVNNKNTVSYGFGYRIYGSSDNFTALQHTIPQNTYTYNAAQVFNKTGDPTFSSDNSYEIRFAITDYFGTTYKHAIIPTGETVFDVLGDGTGICFGGVAKDSKTADFTRWKLFYKAIHIEPLADPLKNLDDYITGGMYEGNAGSGTTAYIDNCPVSIGTFTLEVIEAGDGGQKMQRFTCCDKTNPRVFVRHYYGGAWGSWICTYDADVGGITSASLDVKITEAGIDTLKDGALITLGAGSYIITASAVFSQGTATGNRNNQIIVYAGDTELSHQRVLTAGYNYGALTLTVPCLLTESTNVIVKKSSSIAETSSGNTKISALRIK